MWGNNVIINTEEQGFLLTWHNQMLYFNLDHTVAGKPK